MTSSHPSSKPTTSTSNTSIRRGTRIATWYDIPALSRIMARAFYTNDLFGDLMHPCRHEYPEDWSRFWLRIFQRDYFKHGYVLVAATETDEHGKEDIVGVAQWERCGGCEVLVDIEGDQSRGRKSTWWDLRPYVFPGLVRCYITIVNWIRPSRSISPKKSIQSIIDDSEPFVAHYWMHEPAPQPPVPPPPPSSTSPPPINPTFFSRFLSLIFPLFFQSDDDDDNVLGTPKRNWYLNFLGIDPAHQGKHYGQSLVNWGMRRAQVENEIQIQRRRQRRQHHAQNQSQSYQDQSQTRNDDDKSNSVSKDKTSVSVSVVCAKGTLSFYQRCGFDTLAGTVRAAGTGKYKDMLNPFEKGGVAENVGGGEVLFRYFEPDSDVSASSGAGTGIEPGDGLDGDALCVHTRWHGEDVVHDVVAKGTIDENQPKSKTVHVKVDEIRV